MTFTPDQYSQIAQGYDKAAADPLVPTEQRQEFAKKADWFHFLARRGTGTQRPSSNSNDENVGPISRDIVIPHTSARPKRTMAPFLTALWITGAGLYLIGTLLFTNAVNLFGNDERKKPLTETSWPAESLPKVASVEEKSVEQGDRQIKPEADRPHAISPDQPPYESPILTAPSSTVPQEELGAPSPSEPIQDLVIVPSSEILMVLAAATIRKGPSTTAKKIGTANAGAKLQVKAREREWVQFVDPSSGNTGWIQSSLLAEASSSEAKEVAAPKAAEIPTAEPRKPTAEAVKPKLVKKRVRQEPGTPTQVTERPRTYVELPADGEFLPPRRRGPGFLNKRRMLREGLMSPGFVPPQ